MCIWLKAIVQLLLAACPLLAYAHACGVGPGWCRINLEYGNEVAGQHYTETVELLRPAEWVRGQRLQVGGPMTLSLPEFGIESAAAVVRMIDGTDIDPATPGPVSNARAVIGRFERHVPEVGRYTFRYADGRTETLTATAEHPLFSIKRQTFVPIGSLEPDSEPVRTANGRALLVARERVAAVTPVFNLEVYDRHNYFVGDGGLLAHNVCVKGELSDDAKFNLQAMDADRNFIGLMDLSNGRVEIGPTSTVGVPPTRKPLSSPYLVKGQEQTIPYDRNASRSYNGQTILTPAHLSLAIDYGTPNLATVNNATYATDHVGFTGRKMANGTIGLDWISGSLNVMNYLSPEGQILTPSSITPSRNIPPWYKSMVQDAFRTEGYNIFELPPRL